MAFAYRPGRFIRRGPPGTSAVAATAVVAGGSLPVRADPTVTRRWRGELGEAAADLRFGLLKGLMRQVIRRPARAVAACLILPALAAGCASGTPGDGPSIETSPSGGTLPYVVRTTGPGDQAPNEADNNRWKQRHELTADERRTGEAIAARIRPVLLRLRTKGDFRPEATRQALLGLGYRAQDVQVTAMRIPSWEDATTPPPGAVYAVRFGQVGCVIGDVTPSRVATDVTGTAAEFGCLEPFSH